MRIVLIVLGCVVAAVLAAVAALYFLFPVERVKTEIEAAVERLTGRALTLAGPVHFTFYPVLGVEAEKVALANAEGGKAPNLLTAEAVSAGVKLLPLLSGDVEITRLVLTRPVLALEVDAQNAPNWDIAPKPAPESEQQELKSLSLADVRVIDGALSFESVADGVRHDVSAINLAMALPSLDQPLTLDGGFTYREEPASVALRFDRPRAFLEAGETPMRLDLKEGPATGALEGTFDAATAAVTGAANVKGESFRRVSAWVGAPLGPGPGFGPFEAQGALRFADGALRLDDAGLALDQVRGEGDISLLTEGPRPKLVADLALEALDLNAYIAPDGADTRGVDVQNAGWSEAPLDFSGLRGFDADLGLRTGRLTFQKMTFDRARLDLTLVDGVADAKLSDLAVYGGTGSGRLILDGRFPATVVRQTLNLEGVNALPFLTDAIGMDRISGKAALTLDVSGAGRSQKAIMESLKGAASLQFRDGDLKGVDLDKVARTIRNALAGEAIGPAADTDFTAFDIALAMRDGVAAMQTMQLEAPFLRMTGTGTIDLGAQTANLLVKPRAVLTTEGQGGAASASGLTVPFKITGPWSKLKYSPDLTGAAEAALRKELDKVLKSDTSGAGSLVGGLLDSVTGRKRSDPAPSDPAQPAEEQTPAQKPANPLERLFGRPPG